MPAAMIRLARPTCSTPSSLSTAVTMRSTSLSICAKKKESPLFSQEKLQDSPATRACFLASAFLTSRKFARANQLFAAVSAGKLKGTAAVFKGTTADHQAYALIEIAQSRLMNVRDQEPAPDQELVDLLLKAQGFKSRLYADLIYFELARLYHQMPDKRELAIETQAKLLAEFPRSDFSRGLLLEELVFGSADPVDASGAKALLKRIRHYEQLFGDKPWEEDASLALRKAALIEKWEPRNDGQRP